MGYCNFCRSRTELFCFVHKQSVCESCLVQEPRVTSPSKTPCQAHCVVKSVGSLHPIPMCNSMHAVVSPRVLHCVCFGRKYLAWIDSADYEWPPRCGFCNKVVSAHRESVIRLPCLCVVHRSCFKGAGHDADSIHCPVCDTPALARNQSGNSLLAETLREFLQPASPQTELAARVRTRQADSSGLVARFKRGAEVDPSGVSAASSITAAAEDKNTSFADLEAGSSQSKHPRKKRLKSDRLRLLLLATVGMLLFLILLHTLITPAAK